MHTARQAVSGSAHCRGAAVRVSTAPVKSRTFPRLPLAGLALCAIAGIAAGEWIAPDPAWTVLVAIAALLAAWQSPNALWAAVIAAFTAVHVWQWQENPSRLWAEAVASAPRAVQVTGILIDEPVPVEGSADRWRARLRTAKWKIDGREVSQKSELTVRWRSEKTPRYGDRWMIEGIVARPPPPRNPGEFNAISWLGRQGIFLEVRGREADASRRLAQNQGSSIKTAALQARGRILHTLGLGLEDAPTIRALIAAITLGARDDAAEEFNAAFRQTGTLHLFSVSGLHVGMFALLLWMVLQPLRVPRRAAVFIIVPMLFFYSLVTGAAPSSLRAATMISLVLGALLIDRAPSTGNSLAAAALLILGFDTNQLFQPGFQLSFLVVGTLLLLTPPIDRSLVRAFCPDPFIPRRLYNQARKLQHSAGRALAATLAVSLAAFAGGLPLTAAYFHLVPLVSVAANMIAVPLSFCVLALGMLSVLAGMVSSALAAVFNAANWGVTSVLLAFVQWAAALPGAYLSLPPAWLRPPAQVTVFDLGTGGAQLLLTRQSAWLFDAGSARDFATVIEPAMRAEGVRKLDAFVLTHGDAEHAGGATELAEIFLPSSIMDSTVRDRSAARRAFHQMLRGQNKGKHLVFPAETAALGDDSSVTFLHPPAGTPGRTADDQCVVARIDCGRFRTLLMSDSGAETEAMLLRGNHGDLRADILVLGRHAEDLFAKEEFLAAVRPRVVVLAAPDSFREGSDEPALRERLAATGAEIFNQEECGAVTITFRPGHAEIRGFLDRRSVEILPR
jgi:ComEC/Rec2-related protein